MNVDLHAILNTERRRARFNANVEAGDPAACWHWLRAINSSGYGVLRVGHNGLSHTVMAHRAAWMLHHHSDLPEGAVIDHLCRNRACCNPAHLEAVTQSANIRRSTSYKSGDGAVVRRGPVTFRLRGEKVMAQWREYLDSGKVRQCGKTFPDRAAAEAWTG